VHPQGEREAFAATPRLARGFTLVELALTVALIGVLSAISASGYTSYRDRARMTQVIVDIKYIATELDGYEAATGQLPSTLGPVGCAGQVDIWGNLYQYLRLNPKGIGQPRKDKFIVPINSDFDLYSLGPDGMSSPPLTAKSSRDDIVRASNGSYIGVAANY
jgi:general secretion pathway protein G